MKKENGRGSSLSKRTVSINSIKSPKESEPFNPKQKIVA
jgi:hypothetical protein